MMMSGDNVDDYNYQARARHKLIDSTENVENIWRKLDWGSATFL